MMRALGDSKVPLYFLILTCFMNIILDYVTILVFHMGVAGAGFATIFSQLISAIFCAVYIWKKMPAYHITVQHLAVSKKELSRHFSQGLTVARGAPVRETGAARHGSESR